MPLKIVKAITKNNLLKIINGIFMKVIIKVHGLKKPELLVNIFVPIVLKTHYLTAVKQSVLKILIFVNKLIIMINVLNVPTHML